MLLDDHLISLILRAPGVMEQMFDSLPDVLVYVKDSQGRYIWVNRTLVERAGLRSREQAIGLTSDQLFSVTGSGTLAQDLRVIRSMRATQEHLRMYRTRRGDRYWCMSSKFPFYDDDGRVAGLIGLSRDLPRPNERHCSYHRLERFLEYIDDRLDENVLIADAAAHSSMSVDTLGRLVLEVFHVSPKQLLMKKRIDRACQLLEETMDSITHISSACGYTDHSAFTRQFKAVIQVTPVKYREAHKSGVVRRSFSECPAVVLPALPAMEPVLTV